jgi:RNA polymerase sigma-70 factor (ECF subfamily)
VDQVTSAPPEATDEALVARSGRGDRAAFDRLVDRHGGALFRFAARTCRNERDAEDAVQDGLLAAWRGAASFRGEASARAWLFQVILHACRRRGRRRAGEPAAHEAVEEAEAMPGQAPSPEAQAEARQTGAALAAALAAMPEEGREVLLLRDVEGLSGEEAAAVLGVGLAAMKSRLHRARLELKERVVAILGHAPQEGSP